jgi:quinoprotein glucose dehydrogenase
MSHIGHALIALTTAFCLSSCQGHISAEKDMDWPAYGGGFENTHYSPLTTINRDNVKDLQLAWSYDTHEGGGLETSPIIVGDVLYGITPAQEVFALDAATGKPLWKFGSGIQGGQPNRGLSYWSDGGGDQRIFVGITCYLYALNARNGEAIRSFGEAGRVDLRKNLRDDFERQALVSTSPGVVYKDLIIVGMREPESLPAPPGDVRAYDVRTGTLRWTFHTIPHPGEFGYETWPKDAWTYSGAANNWAGMAVDAKRGVVFVPTGSAADDFYGADRVGDDLFANSLLALNAETGERIWHFQVVKHDMWDRDLPSPPTLVTVQRNGQPVDAVAQTTKAGFIFLFNRENGEPLFPVEYREFPKSDTPGEVAAPTQPIPLKPAPFARQQLTEQMLTRRIPEAHRLAVKKFRTLRSEGQFIPMSLRKWTIVFPGFDGGAEWGGSAVDPQTGVLYVNANDIAGMGAMVKRSGKEQSVGQKVYSSQCAVCHGEHMAGSPGQFPSLLSLSKRLPRVDVETIVQNGKGRMPAFSALPFDHFAAVVDFVWNGGKPSKGSFQKSNEVASPGNAIVQPPYRLAGYQKFVDQDGYPAVEPPWGTLNAIDLNTGEYLWKIPLGEYPELAAKGITNTGTENYGGPVVTAGGVLFVAATNFDKKLRAFDSQTGKLLWQGTLPFAGNATPAVYEINGREYVVIAAGGGKVVDRPSGGVYVAFSLPTDTKHPDAKTSRH